MLINLYRFQADTPPGLAESYFQMTDLLGIAVGQDDEKRAIERGRDWLAQTDRRCLLIFDNVNEWKDIIGCLPQDLGTTRISVLVTTQDTTLAPPGRTSVREVLPLLDEDVGAHMLLNYLRREDYSRDELARAKEISSFVGGLPVAIAHVAGYIEYGDYDLDELLETFREVRRVTGIATDQADDLPAKFRQAAFKYDETLSMVWSVTSSELPKSSQDLAYILSYLNGEGVPENVIWRIHEDPSLSFLDERQPMKWVICNKLYSGALLTMV